MATNKADGLIATNPYMRYPAGAARPSPWTAGSQNFFEFKKAAAKASGGVTNQTSVAGWEAYTKDLLARSPSVAPRINEARLDPGGQMADKVSPVLAQWERTQGVTDQGGLSSQRWEFPVSRESAAGAGSAGWAGGYSGPDVGGGGAGPPAKGQGFYSGPPSDSAVGGGKGFPEGGWKTGSPNTGPSKKKSPGGSEFLGTQT